MVDQLQTELHPEVRETMEENRMRGTAIGSSQLSVEGARQLKRTARRELGWLNDPEPVGSVRQYPLATGGWTVPVRIYTPSGEGPFPILVWIHGGGWIRGSLDDVDPICRTFVNRVGCAVVSVGYRLAPEYPFPVGLEDCYTALEWVESNHDIVLGDPDRIAIGGPSAGGNLAIAGALLARDREGPSLAHQIAFVPVLDQPRSTRSYEEVATGYGISRTDMEWYWSHYIDAEVVAGNRYAAPLQAKDLSGLPPATVLTAGYDPLRDDGIEYHDLLRETDVDVEHHHYPDMPHAVASTAYYYEDIGHTREAIGDIAESLRKAFGI